MRAKALQFVFGSMQVNACNSHNAALRSVKLRLPPALRVTVTLHILYFMCLMCSDIWLTSAAK